MDWCFFRRKSSINSLGPVFLEKQIFLWIEEILLSIKNKDTTCDTKSYFINTSTCVVMLSSELTDFDLTGSGWKSCGPVTVGGGMTKVLFLGFPSKFQQVIPGTGHPQVQ